VLTGRASAGAAEIQAISGNKGTKNRVGRQGVKKNSTVPLTDGPRISGEILRGIMPLAWAKSAVSMKRNG